MSIISKRIKLFVLIHQTNFSWTDSQLRFDKLTNPTPEKMLPILNAYKKRLSIHAMTMS